MRHIQTTLKSEEFVRLKTLCLNEGQSLKHTVREAILLYLNLNQLKLNKGELQHGQEIDKEN